MSENDIIIWLEDRQEYNSDISDVLKKSKYEVVICSTLIEFRRQLNAYSDMPNKVKGIILDVLIPVDDLADLDMPQVQTTLGNDTGIVVLQYFLRDSDGDSPDKRWKKHKVLVLTTLGVSFCHDRYKNFVAWDKDNQPNLTEWLSKANENGVRASSVRKVSEWLSRL